MILEACSTCGWIMGSSFRKDHDGEDVGNYDGEYMVNDCYIAIENGYLQRIYPLKMVIIDSFCMFPTGYVYWLMVVNAG